jgi:alpha-tubulin suppressor-like RCC1 family protein
MMMATKTNGTLWSWGYNLYGGLGQNNTTNYSSPVQIGTNTTWSQVSGKQRMGYTAVAIKTDGTLWAWGLNHRGELGQDNETHRSSPVQIPGTWDSFDSSGWYGNIAAIKS